jgi:hypothetical protein
VNTTGVLLICAGVLAWAASEYFHRERRHRREMTALRQGVLPPDQPRYPAVWQIWTGASLAAILGGVVTWLGMLAKPFRLGHPVLWVAAFFAVFFAVVVIVVARWVREYRCRNREN